MALISAVAAIALLAWFQPWRQRLATPEEMKVGTARVQSLLRANRIADSSDMDFLYGYVQNLVARHGLTISHPVNTYWVPIDTIRKKKGPDTRGFTQSSQLEDGTVLSVEVYVPNDLEPVTTVHAMAHELGHCWQYDNGIKQKDARKCEGFCEWVAWHTLRDLNVLDPRLQRGVDEEILSITHNGYEDYSYGFKYFAAIERKEGSNAVFAEMLK